MIRLTCLVYMLVAALGGTWTDAQSIVGTWRSSIPGIGESDWQITDNGDGTYRAQEIGLGFAAGTARLKGDVLTVAWTLDAIYEGAYEWKMKGDAGAGTHYWLKYDPNDATGVERLRNGKKTRAADGCTVKRIAMPIAGTWLQRTPGLGASYWTIAPKNDNTFAAREEGLGNETGPAKLAAGRLTIGFSRGTYQWTMQSDTGRGTIYVTDPWEDGIGVERDWNGKKVRALDDSTLTRLAPARWSLPVKAFPQRGGELCWAANVQNVMAYFGTEVSQAEILKVKFGMKDSAKDPLPAADDRPGAEEPILDWYGFRYDLRRDKPSRREIVDQIYTYRKPFVFAWGWTVGGGHALLVVGYAHAQGDLMVQVLDPWSRRTTFITYDAWVKDPNHGLGRVLFNITKPQKK